MRRIIYFMSFLLLSIVLAGCISIPMGDSVLEISTDGIEFVAKDEGEELADSDVNGESDGEGPESNNEEDVASNDVEEESNGESKTDATDCENPDHSDVTEHLEPGFFIPDCAELISFTNDSNHLDSHFTVEGNYKEVFNAYKDYFGDKIDGENQNPSAKSAEFKAFLYGDTNAYTLIQVSQSEEDVNFRILQYFPEDE